MGLFLEILMQTSKHTVWVRLKIEAENKKEAEEVAARLMEHAQEVKPLSDRLTYWGFKK